MAKSNLMVGDQVRIKCDWMPGDKDAPLKDEIGVIASMPYGPDAPFAYYVRIERIGLKQWPHSRSELVAVKAA